MVRPRCCWNGDPFRVCGAASGRRRNLRTRVTHWSGARENSVAPVESEALSPIDHAFTHFDLRLKPLLVRGRQKLEVLDGDDRLWYQLDAPPRVGLPQPILQLFARLRSGNRLG